MSEKIALKFCWKGLTIYIYNNHSSETPNISQLAKEAIQNPTQLEAYSKSRPQALEIPQKQPILGSRKLTQDHCENKLKQWKVSAQDSGPRL